MSGVPVKIGFVPLVDAAPLIVAHEMGFAAEEGLAFDLRRASSWSLIRDMLSFGQVDAAHMLSPLPIATAMGLGGAGAALAVVSVLSVNGNVIGVSRALAARMRDVGHDFGFENAHAAGTALIAASEGQTLRIGVPFPFSMHAELVSYWLSGLGLPTPDSLVVRTVPPPLMADALRTGEIDAFCVGEPWGSKAVEAGHGELLLPGKAIWAFAPEKVLAVRASTARTEPALTGRLIRALWRAGRWLSEPGSGSLAAEILSHPDYLNLAPEVLDRAISGRLIINPAGEEREIRGFVEFFRSAATFPWQSQAKWIARQLAARTGHGTELSEAQLSEVVRTDIYRAALAGLPAGLPAASSRIEGGVATQTAVAAESGHLILEPDGFFDGRIFDPDAL